MLVKVCVLAFSAVVVLCHPEVCESKNSMEGEASTCLRSHRRHATTESDKGFSILQSRTVLGLGSTITQDEDEGQNNRQNRDSEERQNVSKAHHKSAELLGPNEKADASDDEQLGPEKGSEDDAGDIEAPGPNEKGAKDTDAGDDEQSGPNNKSSEDQETGDDEQREPKKKGEEDELDLLGSGGVDPNGNGAEDDASETEAPGPNEKGAKDTDAGDDEKSGPNEKSSGNDEQREPKKKGQEDDDTGYAAELDLIGSGGLEPNEKGAEDDAGETEAPGPNEKGAKDTDTGDDERSGPNEKSSGNDEQREPKKKGEEDEDSGYGGEPDLLGN